MNPYNVLDLPSNATEEQIKQKYRSLAQQHHPDKGGNTEKFQEINLAYSILIDPVKRKQFDTTGQYKNDFNVKDEALGNLANIVCHFLQQINVDHEDLILVIKNDIAREKDSLNNQIAGCLSVIAKFEKAIKRIRRKKEGENLLQGFVQSQINQQEFTIANLNKRFEVCDTMLEILNDYRYGDEILEQLVMQAMGSPT